MAETPRAAGDADIASIIRAPRAQARLSPPCVLLSPHNGARKLAPTLANFHHHARWRLQWPRPSRTVHHRMPETCSAPGPAGSSGDAGRPSVQRTPPGGSATRNSRELSSTSFVEPALARTRRHKRRHAGSDTDADTAHTVPRHDAPRECECCSISRGTHPCAGPVQG